MSEPALFSDGNVYERLMGRWSRLAGRTFLDWLALPKGLRCIDVGCGNGAFTEDLIAHSAPAEVTGDRSVGRTACPCAQPDRGESRTVSDRRCAGAALRRPLVRRGLDGAGDQLRAGSRQGGPRDGSRDAAGRLVATYMWDAAGGGIPVEPIHEAMRRLGLEAPASSGSHGLAAGQHAGALASRPGLRRSRPMSFASRFPFPGSTISGTPTTCRSARPDKPSSGCRPGCGSSSRRNCASNCPPAPAAASHMKPLPTR